MPEFIILTCPSCGSKLKISNGIKQFACINCGNEFQVIYDEGIIYLKNIATDISSEGSLNTIDAHREQFLKTRSDEKQDEGKKNLNIIEGQPNPLSNNSQEASETKNIPKNFDKVINPSKQDIIKIDEKISRLQDYELKIKQKQKKVNIIIIATGLLASIIVYLFLPMVDTYEELFLELGFTIGPIVIFTIIFLIKNKNSSSSNKDFVERKIQELLSEKSKITKKWK